MSIDPECGNDMSERMDTAQKIKAYFWKLINKSLFRAFPNTINWPRIMLLRIFGAKISYSANISRTATIKHPWNLKMGEKSSLGAHARACCLEKVTIGDNCRIGSDVNLLTGINYVDGLNFSRNLEPIEIQNGCWISSGSCVLKGVRLGNYTMVGEQSIVIEDTEPFTIVGGKPAQTVSKAIVNGE